MNCQHIILHRLRNPKWKRRREVCNRKAGLYAQQSPTGRMIRIWYCKRHWPKISPQISEISAGVPNVARHIAPLLPLQADISDLDLEAFGVATEPITRPAKIEMGPEPPGPIPFKANAER